MYICVVSYSEIMVSLSSMLYYRAEVVMERSKCPPKPKYPPKPPYQSQTSTEV